MANELKLQYTASAANIYAVIRNAAGDAWNGSTFETWADGNFGNYDIALTEQGTSKFYRGNFPAVAAGTYDVVYYLRAGGSPALSDTVLDAGPHDWNGTALVSWGAVGVRVLLSLPGVAAGASGGLPLGNASGQVTVGAYASGQAPLQPTVAGRTLDVSAGGAAGVDWANVEGQSTSVFLSGTAIALAVDVANAVQASVVSMGTGVISANAIAANAFSAAKFASGAFDAVWTVTSRTITDKIGFELSAGGVSAVQSGLATASALSTFAAKFAGISLAVNWFRAMLRSDVADPTGGEIGGTYNATTHSQEALRARGDAAWITATGFAVPGSAMTLTSAERDAINATLSTAHGSGSWVTATGFATPGDVTAARDAVITAVGDPLQFSEYTAPNNAGILTAISNLGDPLQFGEYTAPNNAGITALLTTAAKLDNMIVPVGGSDHQFDVTALALAPAGGGGGGGLTPEIEEMIEEIHAKTQLIGVGTTLVYTPVGPAGKITLIQGFDFVSNTGGAIVLEEPSVAAWPATLGSASLHELYAVRVAGAGEFRGTGTLTVLGDGRRKLSYDVPRGNMPTWPGEYVYYLAGTFPSGHRMAFSQGKMTLQKGPNA